MTQTRRELLKTSAIAGATLVSGSLLTGCGGDSTTGAAAPADAEGGAAETANNPGGEEVYVVTALNKVPVGGGKICLDAHMAYGMSMVVTQPTAGVVKAFSAMCTHESCPVSRILGKEILCACHGSRYSLEDGSVIEGPAFTPLAEIAVEIDGSNVVVKA